MYGTYTFIWKKKAKYQIWALKSCHLFFLYLLADVLKQYRDDPVMREVDQME